MRNEMANRQKLMAQNQNKCCDVGWRGVFALSSMIFYYFDGRPHLFDACLYSIKVNGPLLI